MHGYILTHHAEQRLQQRAVPSFVVEFLDEFGTVFRSRGADRFVFDKQARKRLSRHLGGDRGLRVIERWLDVYAVVSDDGSLVTVAHKGGRHFRR